MNSTQAFNRASKHLFRHLHEPSFLRANPIARRFFQDPTGAALPGDREPEALAKLHEAVLQGAVACRDTDLATGKRRKALRQYTIVTEQSLRRRPIRDVAAELGISYYHCYRERAAICGRIALWICDAEHAPTLQYIAGIDEFQLQVDRTMWHAVYGNSANAFRKCDELVELAPSPRHKVEALCTGVQIALHFADIKRAEESHLVARGLCAENMPLNPPAAWQVALALTDLSAAAVAHRRGDTSTAIDLSRCASLRLLPIQANAAVHVRELYTKSLNQLAGELWNAGNSEEAYNVFCDAEASLRHIPSTMVSVNTAVMIQLWRVRNRLLMSSKTWYPCSERIRGLQTAFEQAHGSGTPIQALEALLGLTEIYAFAGNEGKALHLGRLAIAIAQQQASDWVQARTLVAVSHRLLRTQHWKYGLSLYSKAARLGIEETSFCADLRSLAAERAVRLGNFRDAWRLATTADQGQDANEIAFRKSLAAATAAHGLGWKREALAKTEMLIAGAERTGSAPILRDAYELAAELTRDGRFARRATALSDLLTA
jgi:hypothetical protein